MSLQDDLRDMAGRLGAIGWRQKFPDEWTPAEEAEHERVSAAAQKGDREAEKQLDDWLQWALHEPIDLVILEPGEDPPADRPPRTAYIKSAGADFVREMEGRSR